MDHEELPHIADRGQLVGVTRTASDTLALELDAYTSAATGGTALFTLAAAFAHATTNFLFFDVEVVVFGLEVPVVARVIATVT